MIDENDFFYETLIQSIGPTHSQLDRFARARFALRASRSRKFSKKKSVSQSTQNDLKRIEMQKNVFTPLTRCAKPEWQSITLPTPCLSQGSKECPCQASCRLDQNCWC